MFTEGVHEDACYYDSSGVLVAVVLASGQPTPRCTAGPAEGFVLPDCEGDAGADLLNPFCLADAGADR
jgi:hypothetical protein